METDIRSIIDRARARDRSAFDALYKLCETHLLSRARQRFPTRLWRREDEWDLVQATLQDAWLAIDRLVASTLDEVLAWLFAILENNIRDGLKHARAIRRNID